MKTAAKVIACMALVLSLACQSSAAELSARENELWDMTVSRYLSDELWLEDEAYDAGHYLMVPLHVAFALGEEARIAEFDEHVKRFIEVYKLEEQTDRQTDKKIVQGRLNKLHYFYLLSNYVKLSYAHDRDSAQVRSLAEILYSYIEQVWLYENAWQWAKKEGFPNMKERILWKLSQEKTKPSYLKAIIDEEIFTFAIAADLKCYYGTKAERPLLFDILETAYMAYSSEGRFDTSGRWIMQPGVWSEHPDNMFAAYSWGRWRRLFPRSFIVRILRRVVKPVENISMDTSHSHRLPMILNSLKDASSGEQAELYAKIIDGTNRQFFEVAVKKPSSFHPYYRTTNYLDGTNGLYRYGYKTGLAGYAPYELSGTITLGWWAFLRSPQSREMYKYMAENRLPKKAIKLYVGPNTNRRRNPLATLPDFYTNGFSELIARLASRL